MQKSPFVLKVFLVGWALLLAATPTGNAQVTFGSLTGLVTDPGGAVIPGAEVELTNSDTGETRVVSTGETGRYTMQQLKPGTYELAVETAGFKRFVRLNIRLQGSQDAEINASLELGEVTETVEVTAQAVLLDTQSANQTSDLNSEEITEPPLNFRNPLLLVHANAGVMSAFQNAGRRAVQDRFNDQEMALLTDARLLARWALSQTLCSLAAGNLAFGGRPRSAERQIVRVGVAGTDGFLAVVYSCHDLRWGVTRA